jgi:geranylgeranyl diphosphate synthase, type II
MNPNNFDEELSKRVKFIEEIISGYLPKEEVRQKRIFEAMNYSILAGGKRLRPMLLLETFILFGGTDTTLIEPFLAAIEMIHTYSLVHDDLPAMDNDEYRRGRKTTHIVFGEAMGILAGDALLNYAFETVAQGILKFSDSDLKKAVAALNILAKKAGIYGMIGGQVVDMEGFEFAFSLDLTTNPDGYDKEEVKEFLIKLNYMYQLKTGALLEASMMIGAVLAGADEKEVDCIRQMAADIGLAFQIQDDILDVISTIEVLGKPIHSDEKNQKITYVTVLGIEKAKQEVIALSKKGLNGFQTLKKNNEFLSDLIIKLTTREK